MDCWAEGRIPFSSIKLNPNHANKNQEFIKAIGSCGSYLDGGANVPFQEAAIPMLEPDKVRTEMKALQKHFKEKRDYVVSRLREMGFQIKTVPDSTFYLWLDLEGLPEASMIAPPHFLPVYIPVWAKPLLRLQMPQYFNIWNDQTSGVSVINSLAPFLMYPNRSKTLND